MKKNIIIQFLFSLFIVSIVACDPLVPPPLPEQSCHITDIIYDNHSGGKSKYMMEYNEDDLLSKLSYEDDSISYQIIYQYFVDSMVASHYSSSGTLVSKAHYKLNNEGYIKYRKAGNIIQYFTYKNGYLDSVKKISSLGTEIGIYTVVNGNYTAYNIVDSVGNILNTTTWAYSDSLNNGLNPYDPSYFSVPEAQFLAGYFGEQSLKLPSKIEINGAGNITTFLYEWDNASFVTKAILNINGANYVTDFTYWCQ